MASLAIKGAMISAAFSRYSLSMSSNVDSSVLSMSISPTTMPSEKIGTTTSDLDNDEHAI